MPQFRPDSLITSIVIAGLLLFLALHFGPAHASGMAEEKYAKDLISCNWQRR